MSQRRCLLIACVGLFIFASVAGCMPSGGGILLQQVPADQRLDETVLHRDSGLFVYDKVVIVPVDGVLSNAETGSMFGPKENPVSIFAEKLNKARDDGNVKAVVLRINSPGGTVAASEIMYRQVMALRKARPDIHVVASIQDLGASGGYYVACGAEKIYALPSSLTGSIGVIFQTFSLEGLLKKIGVSTEPIKSGKNKDMASPLRDRNPDEMKILQGLIDDYFDKFLTVVVEGRKGAGITREKLTGGDLPLADGRVFTGEQAKKVGLIDDLFDEQQVLDLAKKTAKITKGKIVIYGRPLGYAGSIYSAAGAGGAPGATINLVNIDVAHLLQPTGPMFMYLCTGPQ
jgi:protease-4